MTLILGGGGQLATAFRGLLPDAQVPKRSELDLTDLVELPRRISTAQPSLVINCAAYTAVDRAEEEPELAHLVNATAVGVLASCCADMRVPFVTFSTDYVFDGAASHPYVESSLPNPLSVYGESKAAGEHAALAANPESLVIRTSWLFSATHRNFVTSIVDRARRGSVRVVADQSGCPTYAPDLAAATLDAVAGGASGLLHLTNTGATTWFGLATEACAAAGVDPAAVRAVTSDEYPTRARRPRYSVLGSERAASLGLDPMRPWQEAVQVALTGSHPS